MKNVGFTNLASKARYITTKKDEIKCELTLIKESIVIKVSADLYAMFGKKHLA